MPKNKRGGVIMAKKEDNKVIEESLTALIKKLVTDDNIKKQILNLLRKYSNAYFNDLDYWIKQY